MYINKNMKSNKNRIWLKTEYKRAASWLPLVLKRQIILAILCIITAGMIIFCGKAALNKPKEQKINIGYVAEENMLTRLAVSYVSEMESVKSLCKLKKVSYDKGTLQLKNNDLSALIVLPENVIDEILSGNNTHAKLYLPKGSDMDITGLEGSLQTISTMIFKELAAAGIGMLQTVQAEIYAVSEIPLNNIDIQTMYDDINEFNLNAVINRENFFCEKKLSLTENNSMSVYYGSALCTVYILIMGLFLGNYCRRSKMEQLIVSKRLNISSFVQLFSGMLAVMPLVALMYVILFLILEIPVFKYILNVEYTLNGLIAVFFIIVFVSVYSQLIYQLAGKRATAPLLFGILSLFQAYMSGCIIPTVLLPRVVADIGKYLPSSYIKAAMTILFTGNDKNVLSIIIGLLAWSSLFFLLSWFWFGKIKNKAGFIKNQNTINMTFGNSLFSILLKRLLYQKSFWGCLVLMIIASITVKEFEKESFTAIYVAVYNENSISDNSLNKELLSYNGLIKFVMYDSEEEVKKAVLKGEAECGYILSENIIQNIVNGNADNTITLYEDGDAIASQVVDEVLFNIIFKEASLQWFVDYLSDKIIIGQELIPNINKLIREAFEGQIIDNKTFDIDIGYVGEATVQDLEAETEESVYPMELILLSGVILCGVQGLLQFISDCKKNRFYKRNRFAVALIMIIQPMVIGAVVGYLVL